MCSTLCLIGLHLLSVKSYARSHLISKLTSPCWTASKPAKERKKSGSANYRLTTAQTTAKRDCNLSGGSGRMLISEFLILFCSSSLNGNAGRSGLRIDLRPPSLSLHFFRWRQIYRLSSVSNKTNSSICMGFKCCRVFMIIIFYVSGFVVGRYTEKQQLSKSVEERREKQEELKFR